jgi:hypothetical protein
MKYIIIALLLARMAAGAQPKDPIPKDLKYHTAIAYVQQQVAKQSNQYNALKDLYPALRLQCLGYCKTAKDSAAFEKYMVDVWNVQKKHFQ